MKLMSAKVLGAAMFGAVALVCNQPSLAATDYEKAKSLGLPLGKNQYSDDVKRFLASLDSALDKHDYSSFSALMRSPGNGPRVMGELDWAQANMMLGASVIVPVLYAESLWSIGTSAPPESPLVNFKDTSAMITMYSVAVIFADGVKCADATAPDHHWHAMLDHFKPVFVYLAQQPDDKRKQILDIALKYEASTSPKRFNDNYLCRFGTQEISEGLKDKRVEDLPQRPAQPGEVGTQVSVPSPPGYEPKYLVKSEWQQKQVNMRQRLPEMLGGLIYKLHNQPQQPLPQNK